jgi:hypothetical protein
MKIRNQTGGIKVCSNIIKSEPQYRYSHRLVFIAMRLQLSWITEESVFYSWQRQKNGFFS